MVVDHAFTLFHSFKAPPAKRSRDFGSQPWSRRRPAPAQTEECGEDAGCQSGYDLAHGQRVRLAPAGDPTWKLALSVPGDCGARAERRMDRRRAQGAERRASNTAEGGEEPDRELAV
jgi:hypothetical protein